MGGLIIISYETVPFFEGSLRGSTGEPVYRVCEAPKLFWRGDDEYGGW